MRGESVDVVPEWARNQARTVIEILARVPEDERVGELAAALLECGASARLTIEQLRARLERAEGALLAVSTDLAQDALEDPAGHIDRAHAGFYRLGTGAVEAVRLAARAALPPAPAGARKEEP